jgi:isocitrate dehydrogenase (NAD+)
LIPGDGIGPEVTAAARRVLDASGVPIEWETVDVGATALEHAGMPLPDAAVDAIRSAGVALKGPVLTPVDGDFRSANVELRTRLDLYAQVRPSRIRSPIARDRPAIDLVLIREATQGLYRGIEFDRGARATRQLLEWLRGQGEPVADDSGLSLSPLSEAAARRVFEFAFRYAERHGRQRVTAAHKATVMRSTDGMFLQVGREIAARHPGIEFDDILIDRLALDLVRGPQRFDVLVMQNLYGDIISDLAAGLTGGLGLAPGANLGDSCAVFETAHGVALARAGRGTANPMATILSGALLLRHLGEPAAASAIEGAVDAVLAEGEQLTSDLDPAHPVGTEAAADAVIEALAVR